jgi:hypothetical protein
MRCSGMVESRLAVPDDAAGLLSLRHRLDAPVLVLAARPADAVPTAGETSACSTSVSRTPDPQAIESQPVRLSANFLVPERQSDDGQRILKGA